jgi:hypothetical protein
MEISRTEMGNPLIGQLEGLEESGVGAQTFSGFVHVEISIFDVAHRLSDGNGAHTYDTLAQASKSIYVLSKRKGEYSPAPYTGKS